MTHIVFDVAHNGESVIFYQPDDLDRRYYDPETKLVVSTGICGYAQLNRDDIRRLRDALTAHLDDNRRTEGNT